MSDNPPQQLTVVRHAKAGSRSSFVGLDIERPLTVRGQAQARALGGILAKTAVGAIISSPARRCLETVTPLSELTGIPIEPVDALGEDSTGEVVLDALIVRGASTDGIVVGATHGPIFVDLLRTVGTRFGASGPREIAMAGRIVLTVTDGQITAVESFPAPAIGG